MAHQQAISTARLQLRIGKEIEVLIDEVDEQGSVAVASSMRRKSTAACSSMATTASSQATKCVAASSMPTNTTCGQSQSDSPLH
jgi:tRNA A37 methylthiotransferase MiaB